MPSDPTQGEPAAAVKITAIIPVRSDARRLQKCLQALRLSGDSRLEIVVVDDASTDDTAAVAESFGAIVLRQPHCTGPAIARNRGAERATGEYLFFVDADVCVHPDAVGRIIDLLDRDQTVAAVFGSYDLEPGAPSFISQYKNLTHRFVHQSSLEEAGTFWTGCGAIRASVFRALGGFNAGYARPCIEDIELGARLKRAGLRIKLDKKLQCKHLKAWTLASLVRCDVRDRAIPWTRLMLRERDLPRDLNLSRSQRICAAATCLLVLLLSASFSSQPLLPGGAALSLLLIHRIDLLTARLDLASFTWKAVVTAGAFALVSIGLVAFLSSGLCGIAAFALIATVVLLNLGYYRLFAIHRGPAFAALVIPIHLAYYFYSSVALMIGIGLHLLSPPPPRPGTTEAATS